MTAGQVLLTALTVIGLSCTSSIALIATAKSRRGRAAVWSTPLLVPVRRALIVMAILRGRPGATTTFLERS